MRIQSNWKTAMMALAACLASAACEDENPLNTDLIVASSVPDQFSWSIDGLDNVTGGVQYLWTVTGEQVVVDVTSGISSGNAIVQIRDGATTVRYEEYAEDAVDDTTDISATGLWQVAVVLTKVTGGFSFTANVLDTLLTP
jgi:hypothetical protein